jgi:oxygen-independent coproporphyrinogen-3 oxidase
MAVSSLDRFLAANPLPPGQGIDADALRRQWLALRSPFRIEERHLPLPLWAQRPCTESGPGAWQALCRDVPAIDPAWPLCVYVHVPFCAERCAFCDCYSFRLGAHRERHVEAYLGLLAAEIRAWAGLGSLARRPVSTVHLGGGTPTFLGPALLERLAALLQQHLAPGPATEWALESTASDLSSAALACLQTLGFTRLHVGVQSLDDGLRRALGRRLPAPGVLATIEAAVARGWVVSVDLLCGLPGQTLASLVDDIAALAAAGVDGFSLYELQLSKRNRPFAERHSLDRRDRVENYLVSVAASQFLASLGYRKTFFNHFARARDANLYFTFPERGEDLLALGTIADGRFGDYHYRHLPYAAYGRAVAEGLPGLQGGLRRNELENRLEPLVVALMAGHVARPVLQAIAGPALAALWQEVHFLAPDAGDEELHLTDSGSWFVGNMIAQAQARAAGL